MTDGLILFHAFGQTILGGHLEAYDQFFLQNIRRKGRKRPYTKAEFSKFWEEWKKHRATAAEEKPDPRDPLSPEEYLALPSPYDMPPGSTSVLPGDMTHMLECLTKSFDNGEFRSDFSKYEDKVFTATRITIDWQPRGLAPYDYEYKWDGEQGVGDVEENATRNLSSGEGQGNVSAPPFDLAALAGASLSILDPSEK